MMIRKSAVAAIACSVLVACSADPDATNTNGSPNNSTNNTTSSNNAPNNTTASNNGSNNTSPNTTNTNNTTTPNNTTNTNQMRVLPAGLALAASADFAPPASGYHVLTESSQEDMSFGSGDVAVAVGTQYGFVLDRSNAQVQVLDAASALADLGIIDVSGVGTTNPYDATDAMGKVFVSLYNASELAVATPNGADWDQSRISLATYDAFDGNPEAGAMAADEGFVLVVLQRLQDFVGVENSMLLVVDASTDSVTDAVDLGVINAQAGLRRAGAGFAVGVTGDFGALDGGILGITRNAAGDYAPGAMLVDEATLGGDLLDFVFVSDTRGFAVITLADFSSQLIEFELGGPAARFEALASPGFGGLDLSSDGRWLAVGERDPANQAFVLYDLDVEPPALAVELPTTLAPNGFRFIP